jgi:flagellar motor switch protein FliN/FliY
MSDFLSQDQIDALLQQQDDASAEDVGGLDGDSGEETGKDYSSLQKAFELLCEQATSVVSTVLNREASFTVEECTSTDPEALKGKIADPQLALTLTLEGAVEGSFHLLISTKDTAILSDLMMMGDGSTPFNEDHKDAIGELFNQIMGSYATALGGVVGSSVSSSGVNVDNFSFDEPSVGLDDTDMAEIKLSVNEFDDSTLGLIIPAGISSSLAQTFKEETNLPAADEDGDAQVGLNDAELAELSEVTSGFDGEGDFKESYPNMGSGAAYPRENIGMLLDVDLDVSIELGSTNLAIKRILELAPGAVVELDRLAGEPVDLLVNNKVVAKGEVVVVDENFGIRIVSLISPEERIKSLR